MSKKDSFNSTSNNVTKAPSVVDSPKYSTGHSRSISGFTIGRLIIFVLLILSFVGALLGHRAPTPFAMLFDFINSAPTIPTDFIYKMSADSWGDWTINILGATIDFNFIRNMLSSIFSAVLVFSVGVAQIIVYAGWVVKIIFAP